MKFTEYKYTRPNFDEDKKKVEDFIKRFNDSTTSEEQIKIMEEMDKYKKTLSTNVNLAYIRHTIDTNDEFYKEEQDFLDEYMPHYSVLDTKMYEAIDNSKFKDELVEHFGQHLFDLISCQLIFNEKAVPFKQKENQLTTKYNKLIASAQIEFDNKTLTLSQMAPYTQSKDRDERKDATRKISEFFAEHEKEIDDIYDEMVHVRTDMAKALGFDSYIEYQYKSLMRTDYDKNDVAKYREFVKKYVTPVYLELRKKQSKRIGIEDMKAYDNNVMFTDGNAKPHGEKDFLVDNAKKMYSELSPETKKFFDFMYERELFDLESKKGKEGGGYCTTIEDYESPFIFANFNGTTHDVEVMTHEAGHAFQSYTSMDGRIFEYIWPTFEACEIHSMSMEFLTWPWMELFFEEETNKFKFSHLDGAISFIPYGVTIDHFQHFVYENPDATAEERKAKYHEIELMYRPNLDYDDEFLEKGTWWYRQGHIFNNPFYYIDYTLAQVCAFQFLLKSRKNREEAFKDYLEICKVGGSQSFFGIMKAGNIKNPMNEGVLEEILPQLLEILDEIEKEL